MKKRIMHSGIALAAALTVALTLTGCGGKSEPDPAPTGGQENGVSSEEAMRALDGTWVNDEGYALNLNAESSSYDLKMPGGRIGSSDYYTAGAPDNYSIYFNGSSYDLVPVEDGSLSLVPADAAEDEETEVLESLIFTKDDSAYFSFDLASLEGGWTADGASLTLDIDALEYNFSSSGTSASGTINNDEDGRGWYLAWSGYDEKLEEFVNDPAFLVVDADGRLHLQAKDPELAPYTFVHGDTAADIPAERDASMLKSEIESIGAWIDDAGNKLGFKADDGRYILQTANGRNGGGRLSVNSESGAYEISFNGADYALSLAEDDSDVMCLTMVGGTPAGDGESLDGVRLTNDMFEMVYENSADFLHGSWADDAGFTMNIDSLYEEETPRFDYVSPEGSGDGILSNDEDGMGWYIPWEKDSDGKAYLILEGYSGAPEGHYLSFETDDSALAAVKLKETDD